METKIGDFNDIEYAVELLKNGNLVAFPTETVYGLGANALDPKAVEKTFLAKGRPQDNPLIVHIYDKSQLLTVARDIPDIAYRLFEKFSPGALTLVLKKHESVPYVTTAGLDTVGIRIPNHEMALKLLQEVNLPISAPSANTSSRISPTEAIHVYDDLNGKIPLILDGGNCKIGVESTVLDLTSSVPTILRPGAITAEMLLDVLSEVKNHLGKVVDIAPAPGMKYKHYAPICRCVMAKSVNSCVAEYTRLAKEKKVVIIGGDDYLQSVKNISHDDISFISLGKNMNDFLKEIYRAMRTAEKLYEYIIIENFENQGENSALYNRLKKATNNEMV